MCNKGKIAVLLSTYNGEKYIRCQLESILNQKLDREFGIIVRDDGSNDNTIHILESYNDHRIVITRGNNLGANRSFLELIKMAKGLPSEYEFFSFADQDDQWHLDKLQIAIDMLDKEDSSQPLLYGSASLHVDSDLKPLEKNTKRVVRPLTLYNTIIQNIVPGHTYVFNRLFLNQIPDDFDPTRIYFYDAFLVNVANMCGKLVYDPYRHTNYRQHGDNVCGNQRSVIDWIKLRFQRVRNGDSKEYARQIEYLYELYGTGLGIQEKEEISGFLKNRKSFFSRLRYVLHSKLYRQKKWQTAMFKCLYLIGGYNT